ncbi:C40 family peptidase [Kineococcus aurantiacus]|uniref:Cell wall-associated NlpC family hydrolase n=1 Tax=Kineococcus aurantiacus TaxID=37633 RepID=A0A7Y9ATF8_9ACTN|nr:C40 family peptidase [Kineococcus aurantiacus]NYD21409.1 cell wall-associated NlpC family hydrolase [Kineococcus aurantiacus]
MTTRVQARHRAAVRSTTPLTDLSVGLARTAGAARTGAVALAAGGLLVSIAAPAGAAPAAAPAAVGTSFASVATTVPAAFGTTVPGVVSAPATVAAPTTTVTFASAPAAPVVLAAPVLQRSSRATDDAPVVASSVAESALVPPPAPVPAAAAVAVVAEPAPAPAPAPPPPPAPAPVPLGQRILDVADDYAGVPYVYGGTTPAGFDCSGYTSYVYRQLGVEIPRTADAQKRAARTISRGEAVPGDLVFFSSGGGRAYHVGIYAGGNSMWDSPRAGKPVQLRAIWSDAVSFGRLAPTV